MYMHASSNCSKKKKNRIIDCIRRSVHASIQIDDDVDRCNEDFSRDQNNDDPFQVFAVRVRQLVLQHLKQVCYDVEALLKQADTLVHLEVASHGLVDGFQLWLCPHELGSI